MSTVTSINKNRGSINNRDRWNVDAWFGPTPKGERRTETRIRAPKIKYAIPHRKMWIEFDNSQNKTFVVNTGGLEKTLRNRGKSTS